MNNNNKLKVLTLNIWNLNEWNKRKDVIRKLIKECDADVIGFQEICVCPDVFNQVDDMLADLRYHHRVFGCSTLIPAAHVPQFMIDGMDKTIRDEYNGENIEFGNAIASKYPIVDSINEVLPGNVKDDLPRSCLFASINTPLGRLEVASCHLYYQLHHSFERQRQVAHIAEVMRRRKPRFGSKGDRHDRLPAIIVGDFNADPDSEEIRYMKGLTSVFGTSTYFQDAWEANMKIGSEQHNINEKLGYTWDYKNPYTHISDITNNRRIDYIFVGETKVKDDLAYGVIANAKVVGDEVDKESGVYASDHYGLYCEINMG